MTIHERLFLTAAGFEELHRGTIQQGRKHRELDELTLYRIRNGDNEAFESLYEEYSGYALRTAIAVTGDNAAAADAVQETFIKVFFGFHTFDLKKPFKPWFYRILINECNRIMSNASKVKNLYDSFEKEQEAIAADEYKYEEYEELYRAIARLDDAQRIPIILKYLSGFKEKEIAGILGLNVNTVKSRLFKGKQKLKVMMDKSNDGQVKMMSKSNDGQVKEREELP